ncbi:MAG: DedA family protein [Thermoleophilia bacterium]|nr:DedA family protein [Thermoleophilia bacterium]MDQ3857243.1 DedA family protein [Actinomycetota bacterium]
MFEELTEYVSGSPWTYVFLFAVSALDVLVPLVPSETSVITAGVLAGSGDLVLPLVIVFAAGGAILGDNTAYAIGRLAGGWVRRRFFGGDRRERLEWAEKNLRERGGYLIVVGRFIPGGRSAVTLTAGLLAMPWRRFIAFDVAAGTVWASYAGLLGYFGGKTFEEEPWKGLILAFAIAFGVVAAVEMVRWLKRRGVTSP